ncbi:MAG TPA: glycosyltransferase family 39 protein [Ktedonobacterales bacterium]
MRQSDVEEQQQGLPQSRRFGKVSKALSQWPGLRVAAPLMGILLFVLIAQTVLLNLTAESVRLTVSPAQGTIVIDGQTLTFQLPAQPTAVLFSTPDPLTREFQIDGTDSTNNFSLDPAYIARIASTPYYRFQAWMRDSSSYSSWRDVQASGTPVAAQADGSALVTFASGNASQVVTATLLRPETPTHIYLRCGSQTCGEMIINRNDRYVLAHGLTPDGATINEQRIYFPESPLPFLAEVLYLLAQVALWSAVLLLIALALYGLFGLAASFAGGTQAFPADAISGARRRWRDAVARRLPERAMRLLHRLARDRWDVLALVTVLASFGYVLWVALAEYQAQPHILDASAYIFQAKIFATGQLSAPAPSDLGAFQGPFMVVRDGRWFAQYPPMTSLLLAVGIVLHAPWLVEPLLGTLALWGIYRLGRYFYSGFVSWLAVLLGALSPFYTYLAASYMSHTVALFFAVFFLWMLVRFTRDWHWYDLALAAVCAVGLLFTREFSAAVIGVAATLYLLGGQRRVLRERVATLWPIFAFATSILACGLVLYLLYNRVQTGSATLLPRTLFFPGDRYGFGQGIGFYGQHTLAAGMVILDQLLSILLIDLYGWPFYLTLALLPLAFLRRDSRTRWDIFCALLLALLISAQAGYFYHGIYLGPRYLFETLPFLLLLTARGLTALAAILARLARALGAAHPSPRLAAAVAGLLLVVLLGCNLLYYSPRQAQIYHGYTGLPAGMKVDARALYAFHPQQAIILTNNWFIYNYILWPLNDPHLHGATLYAYAPSPDVLSRLRKEYPHRTLYMVQVAPDGTVTFTQV